MLEKSTYNITLDGQNLIIKFNKNILDQESLSKFLEYLELETIRRRSHLTEEQATALADEIDRDTWLKIKHKFVG
ncbi:hypothetical protein [Nostoc sp. DedQUE09]|uniref:hypothetical protein n=1 Tax=Nostoc sp. DedQUE09 TaxID=3075394 RepID=UPI002AD3D75F|nr:hypothetical protein [Nostoc sp. DedQUE09]MDZ7951654.1 hypothetical protein [Nostoc sp. DedQUE09]